LFADGGKQITAAPEEITMLPDCRSLTYTVISGIDTTGNGSFVSKKSIFGNSYNLYASSGNIYLTTEGTREDTADYENYTLYQYSNETTITRVQIGGGTVEIAASAKIPGGLLNQFSMDEKDGVLRMVVTENPWSYAVVASPPTPPTMPEAPEEAVTVDVPIPDADPVPLPDIGSTSIPAFEESLSNAVYTLDMDLNVLGSVTTLAPDERIYSARFLGDTAYFVTFRQVDPLFSVDLSDPANPRVLGALKIPGFSEYLHPYTDGLLFGFGKDADESTGRTRSLKLSMFDNSDPANVTEKDKLILDGLTDSEASYNHKAIIVDARKHLVAFPAGAYYMVYAYDASRGFEEQARITLTGGETGSSYYGYSGLRGIFIGDVFFIIAPNSITAFDMNKDFAKLGTVQLNSGATPVNRYDYQSGGVIPLALPGSQGLVVE
ncbi:MAG: beta-propeller domain-containing protein, partial [Clostridiales Family XIII bacterium]|nr:beta-propeller domain-containing protein [Clostridiales Family XIII bacterium]